MAINESIKERLADSEVDVSEVILIDDEAFNKSLIGTTVSGYLCAVYEYNTMVSEYAEFHKISQEEAADYICYNINPFPSLLRRKSARYCRFIYGVMDNVNRLVHAVG